MAELPFLFASLSVALVELDCIFPLVALELERSVDWSVVVVVVLLAAGVVAESLLIVPLEVLAGEVVVLDGVLVDGELVVLLEVAELVVAPLLVDCAFGSELLVVELLLLLVTVLSYGVGYGLVLLPSGVGVLLGAVVVLLGVVVVLLGVAVCEFWSVLVVVELDGVAWLLEGCADCWSVEELPPLDALLPELLLPELDPLAPPEPPEPLPPPDCAAATPTERANTKVVIHVRFIVYSLIGSVYAVLSGVRWKRRRPVLYQGGTLAFNGLREK